MGSKRTKEDDVLKISTSVFVTNFSEQASAKDLWNACKQYGHVVDAFILNKRSKAGKRFGFVRFIKVFDVERLVGNLCTVWIGRHRIHANVARLHRPKGSTSSRQPAMKRKIRDSSIGNTKDNGHRDDVSSYANVVKNQSQGNRENDSKQVLVLDDSCSIGNEGFTDIDLRYMGGLWVMIAFDSVEAKEKFLFIFRVVSRWFSQLIQASSEFITDERVTMVEIEGKTQRWVRAIVDSGLWTQDLMVEEENPKSKDGVVSSEQNGKQSEDPFNIYSLLNKDKMKNNKEASTKESLEYPPGFTPRENDVENVEMDNQKDNCDGEFGNVNNISDEVNFSSGFNTYKKAGGESMDSDHCRESEGSRKGGSILMLMDELVKVGQTMGYNMDGCMKNIEEIIESQGVDGVNFLTLQETKMESIDLFEIKRCWGNFAFDYVHSASVGKSGGILCVWDPNAFKKLNSTASDYFVMIQGNWVSNGKLLLIISVYAPQELSEKKSLWDYLCHVIDNWKGSVIIMGDFNEVRNKNERFGTIFNVHGANAFNSFISMANLEEVPLGGCSFTWCHRSASKMSKLDRFLMSESLLSECPNLSAITLDRFLSDHRPILLRESTHDYGPIPFRFFHYWLEMEGFENFVNEVWREAPVDNSNAMINMMNKLKYLKKKIRVWNGMRQSPKTRKHVLKQELADLEMIIDKGDASSDTLHKRAEVVKSIQEVDKLCAMEASQKAKIKWAIEGDENSKYYHGILNKKRNQLSIRGVLVEGDWVENPNMVKNEFLNHFKNRFDRPKSVRPMLNMEFPHHLNSMQQLDLEAEVSNEEIKKAVWDCGVDKSPGPDGFTFGFYKRFWSLIEKDVLAAVKYFFHYSRIPKGCNSSFIALIPKTPEAKMVKDFRPISLIGSLYKIIAKILANRLVVVLGDIVNEVQSAFVADRQILDGPFILNEVLQWCKLKKKYSFILKIDFEKAYDSVRWDYLDDVLRKFGLGEKWCGDPLSPFLFILVMESLHISFKRVVDAGMFHGIVLNSSMQLSHMFYADDVVFMGQWSTKNTDTIIYVLECFHRASGLSINLSKSKLLGVVVSEDRVVQATNRIGCGVLKVPFAYLAIHGEDGKNGSGFKVGYKSIWRNIPQEVETLKTKGMHLYSFMQKKIGNGADTYFWEDLWHGDMVLKQRFPRLYALEVHTFDEWVSWIVNLRMPVKHKRVGIDVMCRLAGLIG
ncbi:RNA-directed DNA polymerase, eukaryota [Tanacetum coccineum]